MIRRLGPDDAEVLKELRLGALADAPTAYAVSHDEEARRPLEQWRDLLRPGPNPTFVWEDERGPQGMVVGVHDASGSNVVHLFAMWVRPSVRGTGVADALVDRVVRWAREQSASSVRLHVTSGNDPAEHLYVRHGFVRTGRTRRRERDDHLEFEMEVTV